MQKIRPNLTGKSESPMDAEHLDAENVFRAYGAVVTYCPSTESV